MKDEIRKLEKHIERETRLEVTTSTWMMMSSSTASVKNPSQKGSPKMNELTTERHPQIQCSKWGPDIERSLTWTYRITKAL